MASSGDNSNAWRRPWVRRLGMVLLALAVVLSGIYAAFPWLASALAPRLAPWLGLDRLEVVVRRPGLTALHLQTVTLVSGRVQLTVHGGRLLYGPADLAAGRVEAVLLREVVLRVAGAESAAGGTPAGGGHSPLEMEPLFAALPAERVAVETLEVLVPALNFHAVGSLGLTGRELNVELDGVRPDRAEGFELRGRLGADGAMRVQLAERGTEGPPFLAVTSTLGGPRLGLNAEVDLRGFALDLAAELAGLPAGEGRVRGSVHAQLPWPLPEAWPMPELVAGGDIQVEWQPASRPEHPADAGPWALADGSARWRLENGELSGEAEGMVTGDKHRFRVQTALRSWRLADAEGTGALTIGAGTGPPLLDLSWDLGDDALGLEGSFRLDQPALELIAGEVGLPSGRGAVAGEVSTRLPWPLPEPWQDLRPPGHGTLTGHWQSGAGDLQVQRLAADWRLEDRRLAGSVEGELQYRGLGFRAVLDVDALTLEDRLLAAGGTGRLGDVMELPFTGSHHLDQGVGKLEVSGDVDVKRPLAESLLDGWDEPFDVTAGHVSLAAELGWQADLDPAGTFQVDLTDMDAYYQDYLVAGATGALEFAGGVGRAWTLEPSPLHVAALDTGVEISNVDTGLAWSGDTLTVSATTAELLGGAARVATFAYDAGAGQADVVVDLEDLNLARILALEGEQVSGTGTLDGTLPVRVRGNAPAIVAGDVRAEPPGGVLRISPELAGGMGQPGLDFALRALQDFRYDVLQADVTYRPSGDLTLAVHLEGRNPEIEGGRPIHYNVTVNENLPVLLKALRLQDDLTREIERRMTD